MQLRFVSKEEARKLIDDMPGDGIYIMTYNEVDRISDQGKYIKKKKGKKYVNKSRTLVLVDSKPVLALNLHNRIINDLSTYDGEDIVRSIMLAKLE